VQTSEQVAELYAALIDAQAEFSAVEKAADNPFFKSKYADLPAIMREVGPVLAKHGLGITQPPDDGALVTRLVHKSGQWQESRLELQPVKADPQAMGSAITYLRRYMLCAVLNVVTEVDDDGDKASPRPAPKAKPAPRPAPAVADSPADVPPALLRGMHAAFSQCGYEERPARLAFASAVVGRDLSSSKDLGREEVLAIMRELEAVALMEEGER
jgi:hypothetical protein